MITFKFCCCQDTSDFHRWSHFYQVELECYVCGCVLNLGANAPGKTLWLQECQLICISYPKVIMSHQHDTVHAALFNAMLLIDVMLYTVGKNAHAIIVASYVCGKKMWLTEWRISLIMNNRRCAAAASLRPTRRNTSLELMLRVRESLAWYILITCWTWLDVVIN